MATPDIVEPDFFAVDPVIEAYKKDVDITLIDHCLRLTTEQRAQQLLNATRFIKKFRPLVMEAERASR